MTNLGTGSVASLLAMILASSLLAQTQDVPAPKGRWNFDNPSSKTFTSNGAVTLGQAGPRPPEFPDKAPGNKAVQLNTAAYLSVPDPGSNSQFDFANGDTITLEGWVNPSNVREGQVCYVIGKGRTGSPRFLRDNQNWSLRIVGSKGQACLSFLFATKLSATDKHWHRWDSTNGFPPATGWHHIAITYRFGDPKSIRGWVNGKPTGGNWSYGGPTKESPVNDDDEIRIGNGFDGLLDEIVIHRTPFTDKIAAAKFHRVGKSRIVGPQPEKMPVVAKLPDGKILYEVFEGLPSSDRWLNDNEEWPKESVSWTGEHFLLHRIPLQYDSWGIRSPWKAPVLLRISADVNLPPGKQRFMVRARALGRLWIDGQLIARTQPITTRPPDGEERIIPVAMPPIPGARIRSYRQQEVFGEATIRPAPSGKSRVVLELVVGGKQHRTETGEVCVAVLSADGKHYELLGTKKNRILLTDNQVEPVLHELEKQLGHFDDRRRRRASESQNRFWESRHDFAKSWATKNSMADPPEKDAHPIDAWIQLQIRNAIAQAEKTNEQDSKHFHNNVLPVLREQCFRCHGEKDKGGIKLDSRAAALAKGDSDLPAVVPGDLDASELITRIRTDDEGSRMPPTEKGLNEEQIKILENWVESGASWPAPPLKKSQVAIPPALGDSAFIRRVYLDTVGVPPSSDTVIKFLDDPNPGKRENLIDHLLKDERFADHWMPFWLDLLAENPTLLNASLNSTGPFRWFLYDSLRDNKPIDRMVTELLLMRGGAAEGGSAGFALAGENDAPMAAKGHIIASAFLGIELQCARCHDSPYHDTTQRDLYSLAAMLDRKPVKVPITSQVPAAFFENQKVRKSLIQVTLKANQMVEPIWPFASVTGIADGAEFDSLMQSPSDTRERLAALITAPQNSRFSRVIVNRIWKQLMGAGFVEPVHDWEGREASHPELLGWLAQELVTHDYDFRHIVRLIITSNTYQRRPIGNNLKATAKQRFFNAPDPRRLSAEQVVDSLHFSTGRPVNTEELTFVHDGRRPLGSRQTLGVPTRAWMFGDLKNERDRPSLSLPKARAVVDVLEAFGWTGARQMPITARETDPNLLQPGILANGTLSVALTRVSFGSELADLAVESESPEKLAETLFLRFFSRRPNPDEKKVYSKALAIGFESRLLPADKVTQPKPYALLPQVTWFNHGRPKANEIQLEIERRVKAGPPADPRLDPNWRAIYEDAIWSLINHREFVWIP